MSCHESLMARRRKKSKAAAAQAKAKEKEEKSLPALPPSAIPQGAFTEDPTTTPQSGYEEGGGALEPPRSQYQTNESSRSSSRRATSPERDSSKDAGLTLPTTTYKHKRNSMISQQSDATGGDEGFFIPLALDPSPAPQYAPRTTSQPKKENVSKDYFGTSRATGRLTGGTGTPNSQISTPHIAFQANGRSTSTDNIDTPKDSPKRLPVKSASRNASAAASPAIGSDEHQRNLAEALMSGYANDKTSSTPDQFKLQDVPKRKKSSDSRVSSNTDSNKENPTPAHISAQMPRKDISSQFNRSDSSDSASQKRGDSQFSEKVGTPSSTIESRYRGDSGSTLSSETPRSQSKTDLKSIPRKEIGGYSHKPSASLARLEALSNPQPTADSSSSGPTVNGKSISPPVVDDSALQNRTLTRPPPPQQKVSDTYLAPRAPPAPPQEDMGNKLSKKSKEPPSPGKLPRWSAGGDFTMDEDMARILGADEGSESILRRVSNAVRHGRTGSQASISGRQGHMRSNSETTARGVASPNWPKTPIHEHEPGHTRNISSPISLTGRGDDVAMLRRQLRNSELRVAELERQIEGSKNLSTVNKQLVEKRKTVSELDSQAELMVRQIEALAGYVEKAKNTKGPINFQELEDSAIKEFVQKLENLKQSKCREIETLFEERETLLEEKDQAIKARDRALVEFEQLSSKNAQLADMNNDLTTQIQERFKAQSGATDSPKPTNGLGIYSHDKNKGSMHLDDVSIAGSTLYGGSVAATTYPHSMDQDAAMEPAVVIQQPHVVNIGKGKKFGNWGKKGATVAKGGLKGFRGAFSSEKNEEKKWADMQGDSIGMPYNMTKTPQDATNQQMAPALPPRTTSAVKENAETGRFGIFKKSHTMAAKNQSSGNISAMIPAHEAPSHLFGSDLVERADYEGRHIPSVVIRCIQEVELRGMDVEGIYRKTGGNSLVKQIQEGFEKSEDYDISDPDLDITAVTSVLKQYFRKLPTPLLTFDVYDRVLAALNIEDTHARCAHLRETFAMLPPVHRDVLEFLAFHLARVVSKKSVNLMTPKNIAVVFAPTIMRDLSLEREMTDMQARNDVVQFVVEHSEEIFASD